MDSAINELDAVMEAGVSEKLGRRAIVSDLRIHTRHNGLEGKAQRRKPLLGRRKGGVALIEPCGPVQGLAGLTKCLAIVSQRELGWYLASNADRKGHKKPK